MNQKWIHILVLLVFYQEVTSGEYENRAVKEGENVEISCHPSEVGTVIIWFRVLDKSGVEVIATFTNNLVRKQNKDKLSTTFLDQKITQHILILQSFKEARDSGTYSCTSFKSGELKFGKVTELGVEKPKEVKPITIATTTTKQSRAVTSSGCSCDKKNKNDGSPIICTPIILGPLAGGCGLLLLLLIISILYCNKIRTQRCPHHYKRKLRPTTPGKPVTAHRAI